MKEFGFVYYASIHLESKYHNFLNCKLIDSLTSLPLSTFLINTAAETLVSINKHIEDFELIL